MSQQKSINKSKELDGIDILIKEAIEDDLANTPSSPLSKTEAWDKLHTIITRRDNNMSDKSKLTHRRLRKISFAACVIIILLFASLSNTKDGYAFNWFSKYILTVQGTITNLIFSNEEQSEPIVNGEGPHAIESEPGSDDIHINQNSMTLQDAQNVTKFRIMVPSPVPDGYTLSHVNVLFSGEATSTDIELLYENEASILSIREIMLEGKISASSIFDNEDTEMKEIMIHGQKGTLLFFKDGSNLLVWSNANFQFSIKSSLSEEILIGIAQSL